MRSFVLGSALARETSGWLAAHRFETAHSSLGQSLLSILGTIPGLEGHADHSRLSTRAQRRALVGTLRGDAIEQVERQRYETDLLLWDITHELQGVYEHSGGYVTRTPELVRTGLDAVLAASARHVAFGTDEHFHLWQLALNEWAKKSAALGLGTRTVLLAPRWQGQFDHGKRLDTIAGISSADLDAVMWHYVQAATRTVEGVHLVGTDVQAIASHARTTEASAFVFVDATSQALAKEVHRLVTNDGAEFPPPLPRVERFGATGFVVHATDDAQGSSEFALYVTSREGVREKLPYQSAPTFHVTIDEPGTYRFRLFYKRPHGRVAVYSGPLKVVSDR
jgi:hypothetical protein